jgi:hypothetical protein
MSVVREMYALKHETGGIEFERRNDLYQTEEIAERTRCFCLKPAAYTVVKVRVTVKEIK